MRRRPLRFARRLEYRQIADVPGQLGEADLLVSNRHKLAAQEIPRRAVLPGRLVEIDDADARARLQRRDEVVEEGEGLLDLMIHVDQDRGIDRTRWQPRIVRIAQPERDVPEALLPHALV